MERDTHDHPLRRDTERNPRMEEEKMICSDSWYGMTLLILGGLTLLMFAYTGVLLLRYKLEEKPQRKYR